jgi:hypothetical protein
VPLDGRTFDFALALLISTLSLLSIGFLVASVVPTARFAQPIGSLIFYPMLMVSGLFVPVDMLPPALQTVSRVRAVDLRRLTDAGRLAREAPGRRTSRDVAVLAWGVARCAPRSRRGCSAGSRTRRGR